MAIKVVEHSPGVSESMSLAEQKIEREALLATSLSHPNIIATFKICTMTAGELPRIVDGSPHSVGCLKRHLLAHLQHSSLHHLHIKAGA